MTASNIPVRETKCATCPFKVDSEYAYLAEYLTASALKDCSRICHSTGTSAIYGKTGKKAHLCRGARDIQLNEMATVGIITEATDEAWNEKRIEVGMQPIEVKDPR